MDGRTKLHLQNLWRWKCGLPEYPMPEEVRAKLPSYKEIMKTQWSSKFETLMRNRLAMGAFRYGLLNKGSGEVFDSIGSAIERLKLYKQTGNQEHLVDAANLCLVEFMAETHPNVHMESIDDGVHVKENRK